jgi:hypothetical protein
VHIFESRLNCTQKKSILGTCPPVDISNNGEGGSKRDREVTREETREMMEAVWGGGK